MDQQDDRRTAQISDMREVAQRIEARIGADRRRDHMRRDAGHDERVAIGCRYGNRLRADQTAGTATVLDVELLMKEVATAARR